MTKIVMAGNSQKQDKRKRVMNFKLAKKEGEEETS